MEGSITELKLMVPDSLSIEDWAHKVKSSREMDKKTA